MRFSTDATSYHGHPDPLACPPGHARRSIALYFYTASRHVRDEVPAHATMYRARPGDDAGARREARRLRIEEHLRQWLPPVAWRVANGVRRRLGRAR